MAERLDILHLSGILHTVSFYLFLFAIVLWPLAIFPFPQSIFIFAAPAVMLAIFTWKKGPLLGVISSLTSPLLMLSLDPANERLRDLATKELEMLTSSYATISDEKADISSCTDRNLGREWLASDLGNTRDLNFSDLEKFLEHQGMSRYAPVLREQRVTLDVLAALSSEDFASMRICVGDKVRILQALRNRDSTQ
jgi:hypothetical protein